MGICHPVILFLTFDLETLYSRNIRTYTKFDLKLSLPKRDNKQKRANKCQKKLKFLATDSINIYKVSHKYLYEKKLEYLHFVLNPNRLIFLSIIAEDSKFLLIRKTFRKIILNHQYRL
jgi:hypothetical protein